MNAKFHGSLARQGDNAKVNTMQSKQSFLEELRKLKESFAVCGPELECTLRDHDCGVEGFVVVWNTSIAKNGPLGACGKGGTRITPGVSLDEIKMLARTMALKNAAAGLPLGGAKSGLRADPASPHFEKTYRRFVRLAKPLLVENGGVFGGFGFDIGGRPEHALWAVDELKSLRCFTGKPVDKGGTDYDHEGIAGLGVAVAAESLLTYLDVKLGAIEGAIQGLGAMGAAVFRYYSERGGVIRAISDPRIGGCFLLKDPRDAQLVEAIVAQDFGRVSVALKEQNATKLPLEDILYQQCELLFPCAVQGVITDQNAARIKARYIVEGANGPCSEEARSRLFKRGVTVIPDFIANPGGIIAAFVELSSKVSVEENAKTRAKVTQAKELTRSKIQENVRETLEIAKSYQIEPVEAGLSLALGRIFGK